MLAVERVDENTFGMKFVSHQCLKYSTSLPNWAMINQNWAVINTGLTQAPSSATNINTLLMAPPTLCSNFQSQNASICSCAVNINYMNFFFSIKQLIGQ